MRLVEHPDWGTKVRPPKWWHGRRWWKRSPESVKHWCWHQTAVLGGIAARDLEAYLERLHGHAVEPGKRQRDGVPYAYVYSPRFEALVALTHPAWCGYHGNGGNKGIGIAIDASIPGELLDVDALAEAWRLAIDHAEGAGFTPELITSHRQHSNMRGGDPGAEVWKVVERVGLELGLRVDEGTTGSGRPIPEHWRP